MSTFFTSDLHFDHKRICEFTERKKYTSQEDHTEWLIDLWNSKVNKGDIVYHLGDFSFATEADAIEEVLLKLNGQKFFIKGNHDQSDILQYLVKINAIVKSVDYREIRIAKTHVCLFHYPIASWSRQGYGSWHLHGHSHGSYQAEGKILDVGLDSAYNVLGEHTLFSEQDIIEYMQPKKVVVADHHKNRVQ